MLSNLISGKSMLSDLLFFNDGDTQGASRPDNLAVDNIVVKTRKKGCSRQIGGGPLPPFE